MPPDAELVRELDSIANRLRRHVIKMTYFAGSGHPGGSLSAADMIAALYFHTLRVDPQDPHWPDRDHFLMSKGHACPIWYAALAERGYFPVEDLWRLRQSDSHLQGHPDMRKTPGIDMTSGPLGSGLAAAVGMAEAARLAGRSYRTYVMLGEGDLQEGATWEALLFAGHRQIDNLTILVDYNRSQVDGKSDDIVSLDPLPDKLRACRWSVREIDGHSICEIVEALDWAQRDHGPTAIVAHTVKGWPVSFMLDNADWHGRAPNREQAITALRELGEDWNAPEQAGKPSPQPLIPARKTLREAFGQELVKLGEEIEELVVLDADISSSLKTGAFARRFSGRHINFGVAEQDMLLAAAGMASAGLIPLACTYATFATLRGCEQIRSFICYGSLNVKLMCSHGGLEVGWDGPTHQGIEDIAIMRSLPNMTVVVPADATAVPSLLRQAVRLDGPVYFRMGRNPVPVIYGPSQEFSLGKSIALRDGPDVTIIACGIMVASALAAAEQLAAKGVNARVLDMHTVKPLDEEAVLRAARETGAIVTAEDHTIIGGLGAAVAECVSGAYPVPVQRVGIPDTFCRSGDPAVLFPEYGLGVEDIVAATGKAMDLQATMSEGR
ncbi:MAG: transketolase [Nitrososphaerales archaeon]